MREIDQPDRPVRTVPIMVGMSCVDITLSSLDNLEFYRPPWDDGYLMRKVTTLLTESEHTNQMNLIRTFAPVQVSGFGWSSNYCMVLSLFRGQGQGQGKIFEIFSGGHEDDKSDEDCIEPDDDGFNRVSEVLVLIHKDYCPALYDFLGVKPSEHYAKIQFRELVHWDEYSPEFFFCNWFASCASESMASITCRPDNSEGLLHFGALLFAIVKIILGLNLGPELCDSDSEDDNSEDDEHDFEFIRVTPAEH